MIRNKLSSFLFILFTISTPLFSQANLSFLRVSPHSTVTQNVGFAEIIVDYSRPGARDREIWGKLVPYGLAPNAFGNGKPMPWRIGANENTTITLSHDALIEGKELPAGKYSMHAIVQEDEWTIIFNKDTEAWGSFFYETSNDVLRLKCELLEAEFVEFLTIGFDNLSLGSAELFIHWGNIKVPLLIEFDRHKITLETFRDELTNLQGFNQAAWGAAARYCLNNNTNLEEAMTWIDKAL